MNITRIATTAVALALMAGAAGATSVTNTDKTVRHVNFLPLHGKVKHYSLASGHSVDINCAKGGKLVLGKATSQCDAKTMKIIIKDGKFQV